MANETTEQPTQAATNPLEDVAKVAHGWYGKIAELAKEAQADIEKYLPASVVQDVEKTAETDAESAVKETL